MQFRDLKKQYGLLKSEIDAGIAEVIESAQFISGPKVRELENALAEYTGRKHCISCANGTDALELCLLAWGIGKGDAVFVPSFTFMSTAEVVATVGATPVWVDIDLNTFNMTAVELAKAIDRFLMTLSPEKRGIFIRRYWHTDSISAIAHRYETTEGDVTMTLKRLRGKLHKYLTERGFEI